MTDREDHTQSNLDTLLAQARSEVPHPSGALMARVLADAERQRASFQGTCATAPGVWQQFWHGLGGWPAMGGLATATCAGIWLGVYPPQSMAVLTEGLLGTEAVSPLIDMSLEGAFDLVQEAL